MNILLYFVKEMSRSISHSKLITALSVLTISVLLFFLLILSLVLFNIRIWMEKSENQPQISVYFSVFLSEEEQNELIENIKTASNPIKTNFIGREKSYEIFKELYGSDMLSSVDENPFPAVLELQFAKDFSAEKIKTLSVRLQDFTGVESVVFSQDYLSALEKFRKNISAAVLIFAVILVVTAFFMITNTIKLSVYARQDMIRNMQYIGAGGWYVRIPFILEGIVQGIFGAVIAVIAILPIKLLAGGFNFYWGDAKFFISAIVFSAALGFIGSFTAVKKFVRF